ncbi:S8 family serine peptidase [Fulvivirga sp.]|uniref:S8 family serine peptidase n=1 Tax=Fulvivirga sp. TaxID=1931237 RepID=UPI0032EDE548
MKWLLHITLLCLAVTTVYAQKSYQLPRGVTSSQYDSHTIIVKLKSGGLSGLKSKSLKTNKLINAQRAVSHISSKNAQHPLSNIYRIEVENSQELINTINELLQDDNVIYAEPYFNHRPLFVPNDSAIAQQTYLSVVKAYDAWTIEKGDSSIVIGILDSGVQPDHPDLFQQIAYNLNEPINGLDDDGDGLIDNYAGWDIADNDNNPTADTDPHGTQISGMSSARTNNGIGIAGTGFNTKFLPIKIFASGSNFFRNGYEAIALAADLGCKVINLSWGSAGSFSQYGQDIINYAVLERDAVIVAAAGNTPEHLDFYPASYDNVLSVSATDMLDNKSAFATFSYNIDLMAPGQNIFHVNNDSKYRTNGSGTSFSSPMVAGAAALVRARFPQLNAVQVMERIRITTDDIYSVGTNNNFEGLMGKGRLNMLRALNDISTPSIRLKNISYNNGLKTRAYARDTLNISMDMINYLNVARSTTLTLSSPSPYVQVISGEFSVGTLASIDTLNNTNSPFQVVLSSDLPASEDLVFRVDMIGDNYVDFQYFTIKTSPNYVNFKSGQLEMTIAGDGDLGYDRDGFLSGVGVNYEGERIAENIGLMIGSSKTSISDNVPNNFGLNDRDGDFAPITNIKEYRNGITAGDVRSVFTVADSMLIEQKSLADNTSDFIIQEFRIINTGVTAYSDLNIALFADWNINNKDFNKASWDDDNKLGYVHDGSTYIGIALLSGQDSIYSAINNRNFNGNAADIPVILNDSIKHSHSSQGILKTSAGDNNNGNDVSHLLGASINNLEVDGAEKVTFVFVAGHSLADLINNKNAAVSFYNSYNQNPPVIEIAETCLNQPAVIDPEGTNFDFYSDVELTDLLYSGEAFETANITTPTTYYVVNKDSTYNGNPFRVVAKPKYVNADFSVNPSPLLLDETGKKTVHFSDKSIDAVSWSWNLDNGFTSTQQNPTTLYSATGSYNIHLTVTSDIGCVENVTKSIDVANRSNKPNITDKNICKGEAATLTATNSANLEFYNDAELTNLIHTGNNFTSTFTEDATLYVVSKDSAYMSNPQLVHINVDDVKADFNYAPDTVDLSSSTLATFNSTAKNEALYYWYLNDELQVVNENISIDYGSLDSFTIKQVAESSNGCLDSLVQVITPALSQKPDLQNIVICQGENIYINPDGDYYHFYADSGLTELQAKGSSISLQNVLKDTTIYITNNAILKESEPLALSIDVSDLESSFTITNPLNLYDAQSPVISNNSIAATQFIWLLDGDTISTEVLPTLHFTTPNNYDLKLIAMDDLGCINESSTALEVVNITSLEETSALKIYPNPIHDHLIIQSPGKVDIQLFNAAGVLIQSENGSDIKIATAQWNSGLYFVRIQDKTETRWFKVVKD